MTERIAGRVGPHKESHEPRLDIRNFVALDGDDELLEWSATNGIADWLMLGNDQYGDCGAAATDHAFIAQDGLVADTLGNPTYPGTLATYFAYGLAQGEPGPQPDEGVDNATWLGFLYSEGIIQGYAEVPVAHVNHYGSLFKGCLLGLAFDGNQAIADFQNHVAWGPMARSDGHDVLYVATREVVTWGALQALAPGFLVANATDAWVIIDPDDPKVDGAALRAALESVHGVEATVEPATTPPEAPVEPQEVTQAPPAPNPHVARTGPSWPV